MKLVISGGWSYGNIGDEVILLSTMNLLEHYFPDTEKIYTSFNVDNFRKLYGEKYKVVKSIHKILSINKLFTHDIINYNYEGICKHKGVFGMSKYSSLFDRDTVFVMSGGGYFTEDWNSQIVSRFTEIKIALDAGAKVVLIGQSIGPITKPDYIDAAKKLFGQCSYISVRDRSSKKLLDSFNINKSISLSPDLAVTISDWIKKQIGEDVIGIMPASYSPYVFSDKTNNLKKLNENDKSHYMLTYKNIISELSKHKKIRIILSTEWENDIHFAKQIAGDLNNCEFVFCKSGYELCREVSRTSFFISTKMHPMIIASSFGIPVIGISYNFKVDDYLQLIGEGDCCFKNFSFEYKDVIDKYYEKYNHCIDISKQKNEVNKMMLIIKSILKS